MGILSGVCVRGVLFTVGRPYFLSSQRGCTNSVTELAFGCESTPEHGSAAAPRVSVDMFIPVALFSNVTQKTLTAARRSWRAGP